MTTSLLTLAAGAGALGALTYSAIALACLGRLRRPPQEHAAHAAQPPLSVLKPVCGLDEGLYENLRSFCEQDYPEFEVIFCAGGEEDAAVPVVRRLLADLPGRPLRLVLGGRASGANGKASNLANALPAARHSVIVVADSDMRVGRDYLARVAGAFADPRVGAATCLYRGVAGDGLPSRLGAMFINECFLPSVLVALRLEALRYCFGATMAVRREALDAIGGFTALSGYLADDHMLGRLVSEHGWRVVLAPYVVENRVDEPGLGALLRHELRWARTVRTVRPLGHALSFLIHPLPMAVLVFALERAALPGFALLGAALALRVLTHYRARAVLGLHGHAAPWLVPLRDLLNFGVWAASLSGRRVRWRALDFDVSADGHMTRTEVPQP